MRNLLEYDEFVNEKFSPLLIAKGAGMGAKYYIPHGIGLGALAGAGYETVKTGLTNLIKFKKENPGQKVDWKEIRKGTGKEALKGAALGGTLGGITGGVVGGLHGGAMVYSLGNMFKK